MNTPQTRFITLSAMKVTNTEHTVINGNHSKCRMTQFNLGGALTKSGAVSHWVMNDLLLFVYHNYSISHFHGIVNLCKNCTISNWRKTKSYPKYSPFQSRYDYIGWLSFKFQTRYSISYLGEQGTFNDSREPSWWKGYNFKSDCKPDK